MLAPKTSADVTLEVGVIECVAHASLQSANNAAHSNFETQRRRQQRSKTRISVAPQKGLMSSKIKKKLIGMNISLPFSHKMPNVV